MRNPFSAVRRYRVRQLAALAAYGVILPMVLHRFGTAPPHGLLAYGLALAPAVPIFAVIASLALYLHDEADEFRRVRLVQALLAGIGATLAVTTVWGFLERFTAAPHLTLIWVFPIFVVTVAGAGPLIAWRNR